MVNHGAKPVGQNSLKFLVGMKLKLSLIVSLFSKERSNKSYSESAGFTVVSFSTVGEEEAPQGPLLFPSSSM